MPYKDSRRQREYQRNWIAARKQQWLDANGPCCRCGSFTDLEIDHIDPTTKVSHRIWSWSKERLEQELSKCQVLCHDCHVAKTYTDGSHPDYEVPSHGTYARYISRRYSCQCDLCSRAAAEKRKTWRSEAE